MTCKYEHCNNLREITSLIENPFALGGSVFPTATCHEGTLTVPTGTKTLYQSKSGWQEFWRIVEKDLTNVESTLVKTAEATVKEAYSLDGRKLADPQRGMNILRVSDGTVKKVMVK